MEPYCIEINLKKQKITFHYDGKNDDVIDKKACMHFVENNIDKHMPNKKVIDNDVKNQIHAHRTQIENSLSIPEETKKKLLIELDTKEGISKVKAQVINRLRSRLRDEFGNKLLNENIERAVNKEWLKDALQLIKR